VTGASVCMARTKQLARLSTGGKAPRGDIANRAARKAKGAFTLIVLSHIAAYSRTHFLARPKTGSDEYVLAAERFHPLVREFLKLLGRPEFVAVQDVQILLDDNIELDPSSAVQSDVADISAAVPFEKLRMEHVPERISNQSTGFFSELAGWGLEGRVGSASVHCRTPRLWELLPYLSLNSLMQIRQTTEFGRLRARMPRRQSGANMEDASRRLKPTN
jgi:hypothetical protein